MLIVDSRMEEVMVVAGDRDYCGCQGRGDL